VAAPDVSEDGQVPVLDRVGRPARPRTALGQGSADRRSGPQVASTCGRRRSTWRFRYAYRG